MKIAVFGTGYVGLVTGVCFSEMGFKVTCIDIDQNKIDSLKKGHSPIYEPGLDELLTKNIEARNLTFSTDGISNIHSADVLFIAVGTPPDEDGSADLKYVLQVAKTIAENMTDYKMVITKSTVPVGTYPKIMNQISEILAQRGLNCGFDLASNPEFLREGCAIEDCLKPNRIVVGVESDKAKQVLHQLYAPWTDAGCPLFIMDPASSEMTKYAANAMLATKISLMNELSRVCEKMGANIESVRVGIGADHRIGPYFINAGVGYGGSCFPKDVSALVQSGEQIDEQLVILKGVEQTNKLQREIFINRIEKSLTKATNKVITIWGVAFKPGTDDIREAPAIDIIQHFLDAGFVIQAFEPAASKNTLAHFNNHQNLHFFSDKYEALRKTECLIIPTEWKQFREPDFDKIKSLMNRCLVYDGRNIYDPKKMKSHGFEYYSIGRPQT